MAQQKTNAMRRLDSAHIPYAMYAYEVSDGLVDGVSVAHKIGEPEEKVFKTLVTKGAGEVLVFVVPVAQELSLKKAAAAAGVKSVEMIKAADLLPLTGYVRGGCSPVGMKKQYRTFIDASAQTQGEIIISAGKIGSQMELLPAALAQLIGAQFAELVQ